MAGGINLYRYAKNDPINLVDPLGLTPLQQCLFSSLVALGTCGRDALNILDMVVKHADNREADCDYCCRKDLFKNVKHACKGAEEAKKIEGCDWYVNNMGWGNCSKARTKWDKIPQHISDEINKSKKKCRQEIMNWLLGCVSVK